MNDQSFSRLGDCALADALVDEAVPLSPDIPLRIQRKIDARIQQMKEDGEALVLSDEEIRMLKSFRRFKLMVRKDGELFKWQTRREDGVVLAEDTAFIHAPESSVA